MMSGYALTSVFFFCFPSLLRTKKKYAFELFNQALNNEKVIRISHRGGPRFTT